MLPSCQANIKEDRSSLYNLEQKLKDVNYAIDGVASKCVNSGSWLGGGGGGSKSEKPNFALKCAGAYVEDVHEAPAALAPAARAP